MPYLPGDPFAYLFRWIETQALYLEKIRVLKAGLRLNITARNNKIGLVFYFVGLRIQVMVNRNSWGH